MAGREGSDTMNLIAAVDTNWGIGYKNQLLVSIPDDMKFFREITTGKVVVMGRKTRESFPGGYLKNRTNIVLTHDPDYKADGIIVAHSREELYRQLEPYPSGDIFIAGGESVYRQLLDNCDTAHITKIDFSYTADTYFPDLDRLAEWKITADSEEQTYFDLIYHFYKYERIR